MAINKITDEQLHKIRKKSAKALPDRPTREGYSAEQIKSHLADFVLDDVDSFKAEVDRIVDETNKELNDTNKKFDGKVSNETFENRVDEIYTEMGNASMGDGKTFNYARKMYEESKNKFNFNALPSSFGGATVDYKSQTITINNEYYNGSGVKLKELATSLEVGKEYIINANTTSSNIYIYLAGANKSWSYNKSIVVTESDLNSEVIFYGNNAATGGIVTISNIQIEEGNVATTSSKYNANRNITNNEAEYLKEEHDKGVNLWNNEEKGNIVESTGENIYNENRWRTKDYIKVKPNTQYTLSAVTSIDIFYIFYFYTSEHTFISSNAKSGTSNTITTPSNCAYIKCVIADTASITSSNRQLTKSNAVLPYHPYNSASHITNSEAYFLKKEHNKSSNKIITKSGEYSCTFDTEYGAKLIELKYPCTLESGTYTFSVKAKSNDGAIFNKIFFNTGWTNLVVVDDIYNKLTGDYKIISTIVTISEDVTFTHLQVQCDNPGTIDLKEFMLNEGEYQPYQEWNGEFVTEKMLRPVKIWENPTPDISFPNGNADFSEEITKDDLIAIDIKRNNSSYAGVRRFFINASVLSASIPLSMSYVESGTRNDISRMCSFYKYTALNFGVGYLGTIENNNVMIPVAIYKYKLL